MPNPDFVNLAKYPQEEAAAAKEAQKAEAQWLDKPALEKMLSAKVLADTKLKSMARAGIPDVLRGQLWPALLRVDELENYEKNFELAIKRTYGSQIPEDPIPPTLGGRLYRNKLALTPRGTSMFEHILCILVHDFPNLEYCPFIPPLCAIICHHALTANDALGMMVSMVKRSLGRTGMVESMSPRSPAGGSDNNDDGTTDPLAYFPTSRKDTNRLIIAVGNIMAREKPKLWKHLVDLQSTGGEPFYSRWVTDFFLDVLPLQSVFRVVDAYLVEGRTTLLRFAVALLILQKDAILGLDSVPGIVALYSPTSPSVQLRDVCKLAFNTSIKQSDVSGSKKNKSNAVGVDDGGYLGGASTSSGGIRGASTDDVHEALYRYQRANPKLRHGSTIMSEELWVVLWSWVPPKLRLSELELVFTTNEHGYHLRNLLERVQGREPTILVVETLDKKVFGAFLSTCWPAPGASDGGFAGTGETFLFTLTPYAKPYYWVGMQRADKATQEAMESWDLYIRDKASFFIRSTSSEIAIGGGGAHMGLYINSELTSGTSGTCSTFENQPLTGTQERNFEIKTVEVFHVSQ